MRNVNQESQHIFIGGNKRDLHNNAEAKNSYEKALNLRLYSHDGVVSLSALNGTKLSYTNEKIVKVLGGWAFNDELILFCKIQKGHYTPPEPKSREKNYLVATSFSIDIEHDDLDFIIDDEIVSNVELINFVEDLPPEVEVTSVIDNPFFCEGQELEIDYSDYYTEIPAPGMEICQLDSNIPPNNMVYDDMILSLKYNDNNELEGEEIWIGWMNFDINSKICCFGVNENIHYKRIYFTDYINPFRQINVLNKNLYLKSIEEFDVFQNIPLMSPIIENVSEDGALKAMSVIYLYRLYTDDGQVTEFSPSSEMLKIVLNDNNNDFEGGDIEVVTNKKVTVKVNIPQWNKYYEVECVALEYESKGAPTSIKSLGRKKTQPVVLFEHVGSESFVSELISISDILNRKNQFRFCSDIDSVRNILYVSGLRNLPITSYYNIMKRDFILHGWDQDGNSHSCLYNPDPERYRFIKPFSTEKFHFVSKRFYKRILVFGKSEITLVNKLTEHEETLTFSGDGTLEYVDITLIILDWLNLIEDLDVKYPNLKITSTQGGFLFERDDTNIETDLSNYIFKYNNIEVVEDYEEDIETINLDTPEFLMHGAQSLGFNQGNGIRITYKIEEEHLATAADSHEQNEIIKFTAPSLRKGFMKGEFYRLGLNLFDDKGYQLFTLPLGDIMIPKMNENVIVFTSNNNTESVLNVNFKYPSGKKDLYGYRVNLNVDLRINCELKKLISMVQLSYVERTEANRTILCQGIASPMQKIAPYPSSWVHINEKISNKWSLPYGFSYDNVGLERFDNDAYNDGTEVNWTRRIQTNRELINFDSPDIIYNQVSDKYLKSGKIERLMQIYTDFATNNSPVGISEITHEVGNAVEQHSMPSSLIYNPLHIFNRPEGKFSRVFYSNQVDQGTKVISAPMPEYRAYHSRTQFRFGAFVKGVPFVGDEIDIEYAKILEDGEIISGAAFGIAQDVSNNRLTLAHYDLYYNAAARGYEECSDFGHNSDKYEGWRFNNYAIGKRTLIIKGKENIFSPAFVADNSFQIRSYSVADPFTIYPGFRQQFNFGLFNLKINHKDSIYGGRSESAYESNIYIPLSKTIPVLEGTNNIQNFICEGDTYISLFLRQKTERYLYEPITQNAAFKNNSHCNDSEFRGNRDSVADFYAVVLETQVEAKLNHNDTFYKEGLPINGTKQRTEDINSAYYQLNDIRTFIPMPRNFKDDPNLNNIIATSKTKMSGDFIDNWSEFPINNFYELEKDKGTIFNLAKIKNQLFAIQPYQTSLLITDPTTMMQTESGEVSVKQGDGLTITDHKVISEYGTSIRRSIVVSENDFSFFDNNKIEFVKMDKALLSENALALYYENLFRDTVITDIEGFYDNFYKESNIRIRYRELETKANKSLSISYNEAFQVFNGEYTNYNADIFLPFKKGIFAPKPNSAKNIHELNKGLILNFFDQVVNINLGIITNINPQRVKIFKAFLAQMNIPYKFKTMTLKTSLGQTRTISGDHHRYFIREGVHTLPLKNRNDWDDLRGEWLYLEIEIEKLIEKKIDIFSFTTFVRDSYR